MSYFKLSQTTGPWVLTSPNSTPNAQQMIYFKLTENWPKNDFQVRTYRTGDIVDKSKAVNKIIRLK